MPLSAATRLREAGLDAVHVREIGMAACADTAILEYVREASGVLVTLDRDFSALLALSNAAQPSVVLIREQGLQGNATTSLVLAILTRFRDQLMAGAIITATSGAARARRLPLLRT
jgi:predicted nuclease of predicted toxin-antitoxin system